MRTVILNQLKSISSKGFIGKIQHQSPLLSHLIRQKSTVTTEYDDTAHKIPSSLESRALEELKKIKNAGTYKSERVIASPQSTKVTVICPFSQEQKEVINFCSNNYLGLSSEPRLISAARAALETRGFGLSSVRFICGTQDIHKELENAISSFHGTEDTILYPSCFDANAGIFEALLGPEDAIISDALNHASLIDGIRLCKAQRYRYKHSDMADLENILKVSQHSSRNRVIVTDGVFSMDGDVANLKEICFLANKYEAQILVDDCHATGFMGRTGRGTAEYCDVGNQIDIINTTLGKALGGATGGYTTGPKPIIDLLRQKSRPYLFSNTLAPSVVGAGIEAFRILEESNEKVEILARNVRMFRETMKSAGFTLSGDDMCAIAPVMLGDARLASDFADKMLDKGVYVIGFSYPVVPEGEARIRVQLSAAHTQEEIQFAIDAFVAAGKELEVIS